MAPNKPKDAIYKNRDWLHEQYINKGLFQRDVGKLANVSHRTIGIWLKKFNIKRAPPRYTDKDWLYHQYIELEKSTVQIGKEINVVNSTIDEWLKKFNIPRRSPAKSGKHRDGGWLYEQYIIKKNSMDTIANKCNVCHSTIERWLRNFGIPLRRRNEARTIPLDYEYLYEEYILKKRNAVEISKDNNCSSGVTYSRLKRYNIPRRERYETVLRGGDCHFWNPNRDQVNKNGYTIRFRCDKKFRQDIRDFQYHRDLLTGELLDDRAGLHHFNKDKTDDSHFVIGSEYCNVGFVNKTTHGKCDNSKKSFERYKQVLVGNTVELGKGNIPESWLTHECKQTLLDSFQ